MDRPLRSRSSSWEPGAGDSRKLSGGFRGYVNGFVGRNIGEPQLRAEAQNAFNTPQFGEPVGNLTDANFGGIITGIGERRLQLGVRFGF